MTARDLSPAERAHVDRIEQAPDALGLREEVAEVAYEFIASEVGDDLPGMLDQAERFADALLPLIERREAEAAKRALRDAADIADSVPPKLKEQYVAFLHDRADQIGSAR